MGAEVKQHQERAKFEDQLARRRYDDQLAQQVKQVVCLTVHYEKHQPVACMHAHMHTFSQAEIISGRGFRFQNFRTIHALSASIAFRF